MASVGRSDGRCGTGGEDNFLVTQRTVDGTGHRDFIVEVACNGLLGFGLQFGINDRDELGFVSLDVGRVQRGHLVDGPLELGGRVLRRAGQVKQRWTVGPIANGVNIKDF